MIISGDSYPLNAEDLKNDFNLLSLKKSRLYFIINEDVESVSGSACFYLDNENDIKSVLSKIIQAKSLGGDLPSVKDLLILKSGDRVFKIPFTHVKGKIKAIQDSSLGYAVLPIRIDLDSIRLNSGNYWLPILYI